MPKKSTSNSKLNRMIYGLAATGTILTFLGHGMFAISGKDSFIKLMTGSVEYVLSADMSAETALSLVKFIGWVDVTIAVVLTLAAIGYLFKNAPPSLKSLATSKVVVALYAWAAFWGFVTAASRITAVGEFYPEIWDLVERGPNFTIPLIALYLTRKS